MPRSRAAKRLQTTTTPEAGLEDDPVWQAMQRAPVGPPMTADERRRRAEAKAVDRWVDGEVVSAEIARRCKARA